MARLADEDWSSEKIAISDLLLDHKNPRFPDKYENSLQEELIAVLVEQGDVYNLAREIVQKQNIPQWEKIFVLKDGGKNIVLEGNRRIAAYKCLANPNIAPSKDRAKFMKLSQQIKIDKKSELEIVVAPSREAAAPLIKAKHATLFIKPWTTAMKALFVQRSNSSTPSASDRSKMFQANLFKEAEKLDLPKNIKSKINHKDFPLTTFERVVGGTVGKRNLDYKTDENGQILPTNQKIFTNMLNAIVSDVVEGKISSRKGASTTEELEKYYSNRFGSATNKRSDKVLITEKQKPEFKVVSQTPKSIPPYLPPRLEYISNYENSETPKIIESILHRLPEVIKQYKTQNKNSFNIKIENEYDVQYLLQGFLRLYFDDVKLESWSSTAGATAGRLDVFLFDKKIAIEIKITKSGVTERSLLEQFAFDKVLFEGIPNLKRLFFYVYDPVGLPTKQKLISDVKGMSSRVKIDIVVSP